MKSDIPDCYACTNRLPISGDAHSQCLALRAKVSAHPHGIRNDWFQWPFNFDPVWLRSCDCFNPITQPTIE